MILTTVLKMNSNYRKLFQIGVILLFVINISVITSHGAGVSTQNTTRQRILAVYSPDSNVTVNNLYNDREIINNTLLNITYRNIENSSQINGLLNNHILDQSYDEFWVISDNIHDYASQFSNVLNHLLGFKNVPLFIWSSELGYLDSITLSRLGITNCNQEPIEHDNSNLSFKYSSIDNLSTLLNTSLPSLQSVFGSIKLADCQLNQTSYKFVNLDQFNSTTADNPLLFQPKFKSKILIASFHLDINDQQSATTDTISTSSTESIKSTTVETTETQLMFKSSIFPIGKISTTNELNLATLISSLTYSMQFDWSQSYVSSLLTGSIPGSSTSVVTGPSQSLTIQQTGFQFPTIDAKLATNVAVGTSVVGLLGLLILFLRRYWLLFLSFIIGIFAVFKVPSRKISVMDVYHNETRQNIIDVLNFKKGQGETVRNLSRELQIPLPTLLWHLQILEEFELIVKEKVKREIVIISMDYIEDFNLELKIFEMTFKSDKAKIFYDYLLNLNRDQVFTITSVVNHTSWSARTVIRYISKLLELGIIESNPVGKGYKITNASFEKLKELT